MIVSLDLRELEMGNGLTGHLTCSADVMSLAAAQSLKSSFDVSVVLHVHVSSSIAGLQCPAVPAVNILTCVLNLDT